MNASSYIPSAYLSDTCLCWDQTSHLLGMDECLLALTWAFTAALPIIKVLLLLIITNVLYWTLKKTLFSYQTRSFRDNIVRAAWFKGQHKHFHSTVPALTLFTFPVVHHYLFGVGSLWQSIRLFHAQYECFTCLCWQSEVNDVSQPHAFLFLLHQYFYF